jgi:oligogalacturonide transport system permease protein
VVKYIYVQTYAVQGGIGYSSAMSFLYFLILALLLAIVYLLLNFRARNRFD